MTTGLQLGRPGLYVAPRRDDPGLHPVRLDVAGFVGVALRGPVDTPVLVSSWSDYERHFGAFERPDNRPDRLLPYAIQAFFAQGGVRAYALRVAPPPDFDGPTGDEATARFAFQTGLSRRWELAAANEGVWGNALAIQLEFETAQTFRAKCLGPASLQLPAGADPPNHSLVRIRRPDLAATGQFRWLTRKADPATKDRAVDLDRPIPDPPAPPGDAFFHVDVDVVTGTLVVSDTNSALRRQERLTGLGLAPGHPRSIPKVLPKESLLVRAVGPWDEPLLPDRLPTRWEAKPARVGLDRSYGIGYGSFFDEGGPGHDPLDELFDEGDAGHDPAGKRLYHRGADAMERVTELGLLCVPDLTWRAGKPSPQPSPVVRVRPPSPCDACTPAEATSALSEPIPAPRGLDARAAGDLAEITRRQSRLVQIADLRRRFVALLDVPAGLPVHRITDWRANFDSSYAAAYHPWLGVPRPAAHGGGSVDAPPSSFAAGIIAARERQFGLPWGPANEIARGAVVGADAVTDAMHDQLHLLGVNVYRAERDGFRLSAARTLSSDPDYRQLSVRRLLTMLALSLERQAQWLVFEPNTAELRDRLIHTVTQFLRGLQRRGAFAGATEQESFFVTCDVGLNPADSQRQGRLIAEIGVAPAAPLEYLVLRISQNPEGAVSVEDDRG